MREFEATWSPTSKEGTLDSLKTFVESLRAEWHPTTQSVEAIESPTEHGRTPLVKGLRAKVHARRHCGSSREFLQYSATRVGGPVLFGSGADLNSEKERYWFRSVHGQSWWQGLK